MTSERFNIRMTPQEKVAIIGRAKRAGRTTSEFMIDTALNRKIIVIDSLPEMVCELKALGRNLNQLMILCNMGKVQAVQLGDFEETLADIHSELRKLSFKTGKKLHQNHDDLVQHRKINDEICLAHGQPILESYHKGQKKKRALAGEYRAAERGESWKFTLIKAIEDALLYSSDRESFIQNMEYEGYKVQWSDNRKYITYTRPNGMKCRDNKLHDETYLKENLERLFEYRAEHGFIPLTPEPLEGWPGQLEQAECFTEDLILLGKDLENVADEPPVLAPRTWTDSKQRQR